MHLPRLARALLAACALAAAAAGPAAAAPGDPLTLSGPAAGAQLAAGAAPDLQARSVPGVSGLELRVGRTPAPADACGRIAADVAAAPGTPVANDPALYDFGTSRWYDTPGTYYWQVSRTGADGSCAATEARSLVLTAPLPARPDLAGLSRQRIPGSIGRSNGATVVIRTGGVPAGGSRAPGPRGAVAPADPRKHRPEQRRDVRDPHRRRPRGREPRALPRDRAQQRPPLAPALRGDRPRPPAVRQRMVRGRLLDRAGAAR